ncbi:IS30 family transposase [Sphingobium sp. EP60837]|uniref:IS30 family transposase n=1 Tax=Sphingobium sp. EP60837 TaxID=1855519 RepID=UPI0007DE2EAF|nr:IS30 family transposase [Sphingobium sp. EP60837]ANI79086.1 Transposase InsI for insertion sequence element IS30A [Sphingobium sp. EP60837]
MNGYQHLGLDERRDIYRLVATGRSVREVAATLRRHPSTIYRELKRNRHLDEHPLFRGYFPTVAQTMASGRRVRGGKIARKPELATYIADRLSAAWSPEQIAGYLRRHRGLRETVCHETIYQFVYGPDGRSRGLWRYLPVARRSRRQRYARKPRGLHIPVANTIGARPEEVADRRSFGHWEGDLLIFKMEYGKANLTSLVERRSRFTILARNPSRHSAGVMAGIQHHLRGMPPSLRQSITFDRGTEFAAFATLQEKLAMTSYFCLPSAPWQKGSVENSNGRIRRFLPSDTDIALLSDKEIQAVVDRLNRTPRKCLGYRTPQEVLGEQIALLKAG